MNGMSGESLCNSNCFAQTTHGEAQRRPQYQKKQTIRSINQSVYRRQHTQEHLQCQLMIGDTHICSAAACYDSNAFWPATVLFLTSWEYISVFFRSFCLAPHTHKYADRTYDKHFISQHIHVPAHASHTSAYAPSASNSNPISHS